MAAKIDCVIVGAGFSGAVMAERLASQLNKRCLIIERRNHIGGNAYDRYDSAGVLLHQYGPHYFRTNSDEVIRYLSQFTEWTPCEYRILSHARGQFWPFPINLNTFEKYLGRPSTSAEMQETLEKWRVPIDEPKNSEEVIVSQVGWELYELFFRHYTRKQWQRDPRDLDPSVCGRIPIRTNRDDRYLSERFQALPSEGYTRLFERMLAHPNIQVLLNTDYREALPSLAYDQLIYTGPIDAFYDCEYGALPYRSLRFEPETLEQDYFQPAVQVNYPNEHEFTRIVEFKHITRQRLPLTTIIREYPEAYLPGRERYYPVPAPDTAALYRRYAERAQAERNVIFLGRLATYRYYNMDQCVALALHEFKTRFLREAA
jgi:UDP-galactopyranose mutase